MRAERRDHSDERAGQQEIESDAHDGHAVDPVPLACAYVLGRHRGGGLPHRERHLDVVPELQRGAVRSCRTGPEAIDEPNHDDHAEGQHDHLEPHRDPLGDQRAQDDRIEPQITELGPRDAQEVLRAVQVADEQREAHDLRDERRHGGPGDAHPMDRAPAKDQERIEDDVEPRGHEQEEEWVFESPAPRRLIIRKL